jgi:hypothetical protein
VAGLLDAGPALAQNSQGGGDLSSQDRAFVELNSGSYGSTADQTDAEAHGTADGSGAAGQHACRADPQAGKVLHRLFRPQAGGLGGLGDLVPLIRPDLDFVGWRPRKAQKGSPRKAL